LYFRVFRNAELRLLLQKIRNRRKNKNVNHNENVNVNDGKVKDKINNSYNAQATNIQKEI